MPVLDSLYTDAVHTKVMGKHGQKTRLSAIQSDEDGSLALRKSLVAADMTATR